MRLLLGSRSAITVLFLSLIALAPLVSAIDGPKPANRVVLSLEFVDRWESGGLIVHDIHLVAKAVGPGEATDIRVVNVDMQGGELDATEHYFGNLASEAVARSPLRLSYSSAAEPPALFLRIEYTDANGGHHTNVVRAK